MTSIHTGSIYTCISTKMQNFNYGEKVRVLAIEWHSDLVEVQKLGTSSVHYISYKDFENCFVCYGDGQASFDDLLGRGLYASNCHCGTHTAYGRHGTEYMHSDFCPLYLKLK